MTSCITFENRERAKRCKAVCQCPSISQLLMAALKLMISGDNPRSVRVLGSGAASKKCKEKKEEMGCT